MTGKALHSQEYRLAAEDKERLMATMPRYLPNGASSVGGACRMAVPAKTITSQMMISEEPMQQKALNVQVMERHLSMQAEEIKRRQQVIDRLEAELLKERK